MAEVEISYKGNLIASMNAAGNKTLLTGGKYCEDDITMRYSRPSSGSNAPLLSTQITEVNTNGGQRYFEVELPRTLTKGVILFEATEDTKQRIYQDTTTAYHIISLMSMFPVSYATAGIATNMIKAGCQTYRGSNAIFYNRSATSITQFNITIENNIMKVEWTGTTMGNIFSGGIYNFTVWELADS